MPKIIILTESFNNSLPNHPHLSLRNDASVLGLPGILRHQSCEVLSVIAVDSEIEHLRDWLKMLKSVYPV